MYVNSTSRYHHSGDKAFSLSKRTAYCSSYDDLRAAKESKFMFKLSLDFGVP